MTSLSDLENIDVPEIDARAWWNWPEIETPLTNACQAILSEFHEFQTHFSSDIIKNNVVNGEWSVFYLMEEGSWHKNSFLLPNTMAVLKQLPIFENGLGYVYFSKLSPGTRILPHNGPTTFKFKLRVQLPLEITSLIENDSTRESSSSIITVGGESKNFEVGSVLIFNDSCTHSVIIDDNHFRLSLIIDVWHPQLVHNQLIRDKVQSLFPPLVIKDQNISETDPKDSNKQKFSNIELENSPKCVHNTTDNNNTNNNNSIDNNNNDTNSSSHYTAHLYPPHSEGIKDREVDRIFKLLFIGDIFTGKSSLLLRLADNTFSELSYPTIGVDFKIIHVDFTRDNHAMKRLKVLLFDVAGPERFSTVSTAYLRSAHGIFLCFDVCNRSSFEALEQNWIPNIQQVNRENYPFVVVGLKTDCLFPGKNNNTNKTSTADVDVMRGLHRKDREVSREEAEALALRWKSRYVECSSRTNEGTTECLFALIDAVDLLTQDQNTPPSQSNNKNEKKGKCVVC